MKEHLESEPGTLASLINTRKGVRTYVQLSRDCGGLPTHKGLQQMATRRLREFPQPDTIRGLARGLNVLESDIIDVCARDVGLRVGSVSDDDLVLPHARRLPASAQDALAAMSRELLKLHGLAEGHQEKGAA